MLKVWNMLSISQLCDNNLEVIFNPNIYEIKHIYFGETSVKNSQSSLPM